MIEDIFISTLVSLGVAVVIWIVIYTDPECEQIRQDQKDIENRIRLERCNKDPGKPRCITYKLNGSRIERDWEAISKCDCTREYLKGQVEACEKLMKGKN